MPNGIKTGHINEAEENIKKIVFSAVM